MSEIDDHIQKADMIIATAKTTTEITQWIQWIVNGYKCRCRGILTDH